MATPLNPSAFSVVERQEILAAAKAEVKRRITGSVQSGGSSSQNYQLNQMSEENLYQMINDFSESLGMVDHGVTELVPNFSGLRGCARNPFGQ